MTYDLLYRDHNPYHERRLEQQQLDVLLRIEELLGMLTSAVMDKGPLEEEPAAKPKGKRK